MRTEGVLGNPARTSHTSRGERHSPRGCISCEDRVRFRSASLERAKRDVAQPGSAPEWGSGGRGFKSRRPDKKKAPAVAGAFFFSVSRAFVLGTSPSARPIGSNPSLPRRFRRVVRRCVHRRKPVIHRVAKRTIREMTRVVLCISTLIPRNATGITQGPGGFA